MLEIVAFLIFVWFMGGFDRHSTEQETERKSDSPITQPSATSMTQPRRSRMTRMMIWLLKRAL
jgi:hypothetical protein